MPWLRVTRGFRDLEAGVHRRPGDVFEVSEARARVILAAGVAETVKSPPIAAPAALGAPERPRRRRKKG
ncbi:MAG: hypothetical protein AB1609_15890 [Bacillota bacterium]